MNSQSSSLVTPTMGSNSIVDHPFSTNDLLRSKITSSKQSIEHLQLAREHKYQYQTLVNRATISSYSMNRPPKSTTPPKSFQTRDTENESLSTSSHIESPSVLREQHTMTTTNFIPASPMTPNSTIGLPSHYPGSVDRHSFVLEELQDFDDIFGRSGELSYSISSSINHDNDKDYKGNDIKNDCNGTESARSKIESDFEGYDLDDDLHALSRSSLPHLTLQDKGSPSKLSSSSSSSVDIPSSITIASLMKPPIVSEQSRSISSDTSSTTYSNSSNSNFHRSTSTRPISRKKQHRRSRNLAMGSKEFQNVILEEME